MIRRVMLGVLLGISTLLGMWFATDSMEPTSSNGPLLNASGPDYFMENFTVSVMDESGRLNYTLSAQHMDHYVDANKTIMLSPQFEFYQNATSQWLMRAEKGQIQGDDNETLLLGEVHITREGSENQTDIITTNLYVYPQAKKVQTAEAVQIIDPSGTVTAIGLQADFNNDRLQLLSDVKSQYFPNRVNSKK